MARGLELGGMSWAKMAESKGAPAEPSEIKAEVSPGDPSGLQQMAVKTKSGMQISSGPPRKGLNNLWPSSKRITCFPVETPVHLDQKDRKRLRWQPG